MTIKMNAESRADDGQNVRSRAQSTVGQAPKGVQDLKWVEKANEQVNLCKAPGKGESVTPSNDLRKEMPHVYMPDRGCWEKKKGDVLTKMIPKEGVVIIPCISQLLVHGLGEENGNPNKVSQTGIIFLNATLTLLVGGNINPDTFEKEQKELCETYGAIGGDEEPFNGIFQFRINGVRATEDILERRRTTYIPGFGYKLSYALRLPLKVACIFGVAPFEVSEATVKIEMCEGSMRDPGGGDEPPPAADAEESSNGSHKKKKKMEKGSVRVVRPDLLINPDDERDFLRIMNPDEMRGTPMYRTLTQSPYVEIIYDRRRGACAKYVLKFYIERPPKSWIDRIMPMVLIAALITLNVMMGDEAGADLENTIAIALTAVFVLPALVDGEEDNIHVGYKELWKTGPVYLLFIGMILSAFCHQPDYMFFGKSFGQSVGAADAAGVNNAGGHDSGSGFEYNPEVSDDVSGAPLTITQKISIVSWTGVILVWLSIVPLLFNVLRYAKVKWALKKTGKMALDNAKETRKAFRNSTKGESPYEKWDITDDSAAKKLGKMESVLQYATQSEENKALNDEWTDDFTDMHDKIETTRNGRLKGNSTNEKKNCWKVRHSIERSVSLYLGPITTTAWPDGYHGSEQIKQHD